MKVILLQDVKNVGKANDVVEVSDGYGRNFLLKNKLAKEPSAANMNEVKLKKGAEAEHARRALEEAKAQLLIRISQTSSRRTALISPRSRSLSRIRSRT